MLMISMPLKRSERLGISVMLFIFSSVWWKMVRMMKLNSDTKLQRCPEFQAKYLVLGD